MMTCRECVEQLLEFLNNELHAEMCAQIRAHLEKCPPCVNYVESYRLTVHLTRQLPCGELPPEIAERLQAALKACSEREA